MKKVMWVVVVSLFSFSALALAPATAPAVSMEKAVNEERVKIAFDDLPAAVQTTLGTEPYKGWDVEAVYQNKATGHFEVEVKKGTEKKTLTFDKDGKAI